MMNVMVSYQLGKGEARLYLLRASGRTEVNYLKACSSGAHTRRNHIMEKRINQCAVRIEMPCDSLVSTT